MLVQTLLLLLLNKNMAFKETYLLQQLCSCYLGPTSLVLFLLALWAKIVSQVCKNFIRPRPLQSSDDQKCWLNPLVKLNLNFPFQTLFIIAYAEAIIIWLWSLVYFCVQRQVLSAQVYPRVSAAATNSSPGCATWELYQARGGRLHIAPDSQQVGCQVRRKENMLPGTSSKTLRFLRTMKPLFRFGLNYHHWFCGIMSHSNKNEHLYNFIG